jgi:RNA polymerase sigma-70 factor (ECF subfamily)
MATNKSSELAHWVEEYTSEMYAWALHKVSDAELAKDLVQDTFMALAEKGASFRGDSSPKTYLFSILNNKIIDHYRKKVQKPVDLEPAILSRFFSEDGEWHQPKRPGEWHDEEGHLLDDDEFQTVLNDCIGELPDKWNACVTSKYLLDKKTEDICQDLGITTTNYWQMMHRAKLQLRECIDENWFQK